MCRFLIYQGEGKEVAVIVSSEALSEDPGRQTVPGNHIILIRPGGRVAMGKIRLE